MLTRKLFSILSSSTRNYSSAIAKTPPNDLLFKSTRCYVIRLARMSGGDTKYVTYEEVKSFKDNQTVCLIDVREPTELKETGVIPGSINIPLKELETTLKCLSCDEFEQKYQRTKPSFETPLVFSCKAGIRSEKALNIAQTLGYVHVHNYKGGWLDWEKKIKEH